jgi:hypothetical protein
MAKNKKNVIVSQKGNFEYKMSKEMANAYLKDRKGTDKNKHPQDYLCQVVNNEFGIKGNCTRVLFF